MPGYFPVWLEWFMEIFIVPASPPFPIPLFSVFFDKDSFLRRLRKHETRQYAEVPRKKGQKCVEFHAKKHRKHNAQYYFQSKKAEEQGQGTMHMDDPERSAEAQKIYDEYIAGLEMVGQQEYVKRDHSGVNFTPREMELYLQEASKDGFDATKEPNTPVALHHKAIWERFMTLRRDAGKRKAWYNNLLHRSNCPHYKGDKDFHECPIDHRYPPIRKRTFWLLTRPIEIDWSIVSFGALSLAILTYIVTLAAQIISLTSLCAGPYMCPLAKLSGALPVVAPPYAFRHSSDNGALLYQDTTFMQFYPKLEDTCSLSQTTCSDPGYFIQWPYIQVEAGDATAEVPQGIMDQCRLVTGAQGGYVWDPFESKLRSEFWDCVDGTTCRGEKDGCEVPFASPGAEGSTWFHFDPAWYEENNKATRTCMEKLLKENDFDSTDLQSWFSIDAGSEQAQGLTKQLESCVLSKPRVSEMMTECRCREDSTLWALSLYHYSPSPVKVCATDSVIRAATICTSRFDCEKQAECEPKWPDSKPLVASRHFGCFFEGPVAPAPLTADYYTCGASLEGQVVSVTSSQPLVSRQQLAIEVDVSKKTALVTLFVLKEATVLTAIILGGCGLFIAAVLVGPILLVLYLGVVVYTSTHKDEMVRTVRKKLVRELLFYPIEFIFFSGNVFWSLCVNFSTIYRIFRILVKLGAGQANASLEDFNRKVTSMVNILFNFVVLYLSDTSVVENTLVISSLVMSVALVLFQMQMEKESLSTIGDALKDLNENRLSKFELALLMQKIMEDFIKEDVQYNWVQHLGSSSSILPDEYYEPLEGEASSVPYAAKLEEIWPLVGEAYVQDFGHDNQFEYEGRKEYGVADLSRICNAPDNPHARIPSTSRSTDLPGSAAALNGAAGGGARGVQPRAGAAVGGNASVPMNPLASNFRAVDRQGGALRPHFATGTAGTSTTYNTSNAFPDVRNDSVNGGGARPEGSKASSAAGTFSHLAFGNQMGTQPQMQWQPPGGVPMAMHPPMPQPMAMGMPPPYPGFHAA